MSGCQTRPEPETSGPKSARINDAGLVARFSANPRWADTRHSECRDILRLEPKWLYPQKVARLTAVCKPMSLSPACEQLALNPLPLTQRRMPETAHLPLSVCRPFGEATLWVATGGTRGLSATCWRAVTATPRSKRPAGNKRDGEAREGGQAEQSQHQMFPSYATTASRVRSANHLGKLLRAPPGLSRSGH